ncbi:MAG TPA: AraC family transcriptional regulator [Steroidobacteraceae bacterium]|jgi:AraC-like DNA-binding protein|nr:AraC family transcriptional regulator [Steroidobacteraceae bacterium]
MQATPTYSGGGKTTLCSWVKAVCRALQAAGCDSAALLAEAGFEANSLDGPTARCALSSSLRLWRIAMAATGDPAFGLKVASQIKPTSFHALSYGISASSTLKEAFERAQRFSHIGSDAVDYEFSLRGSEYHFVIAPSADLGDEPIDALVGSHLRMCRSLIGRDYSPLRIEFRRSRPSRIDDFARLLRAPLIFDAPDTRLVFDRESIERPLDTGNPELARHNDAIALKYLSQLERHNTEVRVREVLPQRLASGEPSQEDIAEILGMSARTLQRKLGEAGTTYKEILDDTRRTLALAYLSAPRHSVSDVTHLLGFSAGSCFSRAFRRWTGQSPTDWRAGRAARTLTPSPRNLPTVDFGLPDLTMSL